MNTLIATFVALTLVPAGAAPAAKTAAAVTLDQAVAGVQKFYEDVSDFSADFKQSVKRKNMPRARKLKGRVGFKKPGMMRWDYKQPEKVLYVSDGKTLWNYQVEDKVAYKLNVKDSELYNALKFLFGQGDLRKEFKVALGKPTRAGLVVLVLTPKTKQTNYKKLELHVDPTKFEIRTSVLHDPLGAKSTVRFSKIKYDAIDAKVFTTFKPKKGVRVQDLTTRKVNRASPAKAASPTTPLKPAPETK